jgi:hypothetical protein
VKWAFFFKKYKEKREKKKKSQYGIDEKQTAPNPLERI